jgi:hypothetical protein
VLYFNWRMVHTVTQKSIFLYYLSFLLLVKSISPLSFHFSLGLYLYIQLHTKPFFVCDKAFFSYFFIFPYDCIYIYSYNERHFSFTSINFRISADHFSAAVKKFSTMSLFFFITVWSLYTIISRDIFPAYYFDHCFHESYMHFWLGRLISVENDHFSHRSEFCPLLLHFDSVPANPATVKPSTSIQVLMLTMKNKCVTTWTKICC